ncbi:SGNH/GDSL hydrolase family protein [Arachidicoccus ginsenosidivorans]|nr:SGNH/GDSL hydrolase family protein [Arachidicoccus ginsenosidivorans]
MNKKKWYLQAFTIGLLTMGLGYGIGTNKVMAQKGDWANFHRYEAANQVVKALPASERKVVFMGNSITEGWYHNDSSFFKTNHLIGRGISGQTTSQMLVRFRKDVIDLHPKAVVILAGTNDIAGNTGDISLDNIMGNLASMAELAKAHGIKVFLCSVTPAFDYPWSKGKHPDVKIPELNELIKAYASKNHVTYVDYFSKLADNRNGMPADLAVDGVHPKLAGYKIMEQIVLKSLKKVL